jgi:predicted small integral membrane protein
LLVGNVALYGLVAVVVVIANQFVTGGYFLEIRTPASGNSRASAPLIDSFTLTVLDVALVFIAIGGVVLWGLKQWFAKP